jgi:hypothetical protein
MASRRQLTLASAPHLKAPLKTNALLKTALVLGLSLPAVQVVAEPSAAADPKTAGTAAPGAAATGGSDSTAAPTSSAAPNGTQGAAPASSGSASPAPAYPPCDVEPDERAMAAAKGAFEAGNAAFNEADYPRSITYWEDAYRRDCTAHAMLKNLARAYELNGDFAHAIMALETFLARQPGSGDEAAMQRRVENLKARLEPSPVEPKAAAQPEPPKETPPPPPPPSPPPKRHDSERSTVPLFVAGGGAVVGILGAAMWYPAQNTLQEISDECPNRQACPRKEEGNAARDDVTLWGIVGGVGAAIAVGGVVWYFAQPTTEDSVAGGPSLSLQLNRGTTQLSYRAPFDF